MRWGHPGRPSGADGCVEGQNVFCATQQCNDGLRSKVQSGLGLIGTGN